MGERCIGPADGLVFGRRRVPEEHPAVPHLKGENQHLKVRTYGRHEGIFLQIARSWLLLRTFIGSIRRLSFGSLLLIAALFLTLLSGGIVGVVLASINTQKAVLKQAEALAQELASHLQVSGSRA